MKLADVKDGGTYVTLVSGEPVRVVVVERRIPFPVCGEKPGPTRFLLKREDDGKLLPKFRTAAALRPLQEDRVRRFRIKRDSPNFEASRVAAAVDLGYPTGSIHPMVMQHAARRVVKATAAKAGHVVLAQGDTFECSVCGASCALDATLIVTGDLFARRCPPRGA